MLLSSVDHVEAESGGVDLSRGGESGGGGRGGDSGGGSGEWIYLDTGEEGSQTAQTRDIQTRSLETT